MDRPAMLVEHRRQRRIVGKVVLHVAQTEAAVKPAWSGRPSRPGLTSDRLRTENPAYVHLKLATHAVTTPTLDREEMIDKVDAGGREQRVRYPCRTVRSDYIDQQRGEESVDLRIVRRGKERRTGCRPIRPFQGQREPPIPQPSAAVSRKSPIKESKDLGQWGSMARQNFYTSEMANSLGVVKLGVQALADAAIRLQSSSAWIVSNAKSNLDGFIADVVGGAAVKALQKGKEVGFVKGCSLKFFYEKAIPSFANGSPILACFPNEELMQKVDAITDVPALIVLPWVLDDIKPWLLAHGAKDLLKTAMASPVKISNPVVEQALLSSLSLINVSTGIVHPSDKATVIGIFKTLQQADEQYDPQEVGAWFIQKGMDGKHASEIAAVAANPTGFRSSSGGKKWGKADLKRWRENAGVP